jgi:redox-sensitive bicupin YhaK (pirin superfamily)
MQMNTDSKTTISIRRAAERGTAEHGWLHARFTFSFANYFDPDHMGFRSLRVMNNDTIEPGGGFPAHPHQDMEIFTYVIEGELAHKDSMGNGSIIKAGDLQYMSAGSGVTHSEFNPSDKNQTHLYQIWLHPEQPGGAPRYAEKPLGDEAKANTLKLLFSPDGRDGSTAIRQQAEIYFGKADAGATLKLEGDESAPHAWLQVIEGNVSAFGENLSTGDGIAVENFTDDLTIAAAAESKFLLFRLA